MQTKEVDLLSTVSGSRFGYVSSWTHFDVLPRFLYVECRRHCIVTFCFTLTRHALLITMLLLLF